MSNLFLVTIFSRDMTSSCDFYHRLFGFVPVEAMSTPVFRAVNCGNLILGFHSDEAYDLLDLRARQRGASETVDLLITFDAASREEIDAKTAEAQKLGGRVIKAPFVTYYNHYQVVLADRDNTVFRVSCAL